MSVLKTTSGTSSKIVTLYLYLLVEKIKLFFFIGKNQVIIYFSFDFSDLFLV